MRTESPTREELVRFRSQTGLTQEQFAEMLYCKRRVVQNWEHGTTLMPPALWELATLKLRPLIELRQSGYKYPDGDPDEHTRD